MADHLRYLVSLLRHKWWVLRFGLRMRGIPLVSLLLHDWDKFLPSMWVAYVDVFVRGRQSGAAMDLAWNGHQKRNRHHWQYWLLTNDDPASRWVAWSFGGPNNAPVVREKMADGEASAPRFAALRVDFNGWPAVRNAEELARTLNRQPVALEMPERDAREMVVDWYSAAHVFGGDARAWYLEHRRSILLHPATREYVEALLLSAKQRQDLHRIPQPAL